MNWLVVVVSYCQPIHSIINEFMLRNYKFDFARALCVVWIVCFWHLLNYLPQEYRIDGDALVICRMITNGVLACFTFLSGYFLKKYEFKSIKDVMVYYKKRLIRFYPLLVAAMLCLIVLGSSVDQVLFGLLGLSLIIPPPIQTLWYFSMLLLFYLWTPILKLSYTKINSIVFVVFIITIFVGGYCFADHRLIMFLPFYVLGLNLPNKLVEKSLTIYYFILASILFVCFCFFKNENIWIQVIQSFCGVWAILSFCSLVYREKIQYPVAFIAEASMCAYLFHRPIYTVFTFLLGKSTTFHYMPLYVAILAVVSLFIISFFIQKYYNLIINKLLSRYGK